VNYISTYECENMDNALARQPVAVLVDGTYFSSYSSGLFSNCSFVPNAAALLVGTTDEYYKLKMSWGAGWGEKGYIRLAKKSDVCGICSSVSYPAA
jgi:hypothetical protein